MQPFNRLKLKSRIFLGYLVPIVAFGILGGMIYVASVKRDRRHAEVERVAGTIERIDTLVYSMSRVARNVRGQVLFPTDDSYRQDYEEALAQHRAVVPGLVDSMDTPELKSQTQALVSQADSHISTAEEVFRLVKANQIPKATETLANLRLRGRVEETFAQIIAGRAAQLNRLKAEEEAADRTLTTTVTLGSIVSLISSIVAALLITNWISRRIQHTASEITASSSQIATTIQQQEQIASQQAASVSETTTTMDELEASCRQSAEQAQAAAAAAQQALELAKSGTQAVGQTLEGMFTMEQRVEAIADQIVYLSEQASQIANISQLVSELANQTNMLALNSSVEAVRAGEHGKGFAIVANEIRKLSDQSESSAEKISGLVSDIQKAINATVMVTDEGTKTVKSGVQTAQQMQQAFTGVAEAVSKVALNNQQVSLNLRQQVDAIRQVVEVMDTINHGAKETATGLSETKLGTQQLNQAAVQLQEIM